MSVLLESWSEGHEDAEDPGKVGQTARSIAQKENHELQPQIDLHSQSNQSAAVNSYHIDST